MAYVSKEKKAKAAAGLKKALKDVNIKYSLSVANHSELVCTISASDIDFLGNYNRVYGSKPEASRYGEFKPEENYLSVNEYWYHEHFDGKALEVLEKIVAELLTDEYFNNDEPQTDYFHRSHYIAIRIGKFDKPFKLLGA